ncbi:epithelial membrane protein 2-like [Biomphalaria glabrata]|uniref:Epithelial membrane protein 2-like n=1 Tax=Biomphalaria glabrata TaxID=6526 RepID=A0A9U8EFE6_BIOGL|nr:epithelial membrane protein 2-like [Biomphalaria glabrata]XP_055879225.1 epithelial membrane protein 2-like [Biomphalaria glabrata]
MARSKCDVFYWFGLIGFISGAIMMFVGVGTAYWLVNRDLTVGLFVRCNKGSCIPITATGVETVAKALISTGVVLGALATTLAFMFLIRFSHIAQTSKRIPLASCIVALIGGILGISGVIVYSMGIDALNFVRLESAYAVQYGYSFALSIAGSVLLIVSGSFIWFGTCRIFKTAALQQRSGIDFRSSSIDPHQDCLEISRYAPPSYETVCNVGGSDPKLFPPPPDYYELMQLPRPSPSQSQMNILPPPSYSGDLNSEEVSPPPPYNASEVNVSSSHESRND